MSQQEPKLWIWWQRYGANEAVHVSSYSTFQVDRATEDSLLVSSFDGVGPFERARLKESAPKKIGFKIK